MAENENNIMYGAEFDGSGVVKGVDEILSTLEKAREAEFLLTKSIEENTEAMKENRAEAKKLSSQVTVDGKLAAQQAEKLKQLNQQYDEQVSHQANLTVAYKKTGDAIKDFNKVQKQQEANSNQVSKAIGKFTSVNGLAADGVKKLGNFAKDAAFGLVSGFAGGIIASVVPALLEWVEGMIGAGTEMAKLEKQKKVLGEVFEKAASSVGGEIAKLELYRLKLNDTNIPAEERVKIAKEYNKTADETNKIDLKQIDNLGLINEQIEKQNKLILQRAIATAAMAKLGEFATKFVDAQLKVEQALGKTTEEAFLSQAKFALQSREALGKLSETNTSLRGELMKFDENFKKIFGGKSVLEVIKTQDLIENKNKTKKELEEMTAMLGEFATVEGLTTKAPPPKAPPKAIENLFEKKLAELKARLASVSEKAFQSEGLIRQKFQLQLDKEFFAIGEMLEKKQLTGPQAKILEGFLTQINQVEVSKSVEEFRKKQEEALKKIDDIILQGQIESETKRIQNIRDEFVREQAVIDQHHQQAKEAIARRQEDFFKQIDEEVKKNLIKPEVAEAKKAIANAMFGGLLDEADKAKMTAQINLAFKQFQEVFNNAREQFGEELLKDSEETNKAIRQETARFLEGEINYKTYQEHLTNILEHEGNKRRKMTLDEANEALNVLKTQLDKTTDPKQREQLIAQIAALRAQIVALEREALGGAAKGKGDAQGERLKRWMDYVKAVQDLAVAVVGFWQQVNQAEAQALDRSIALQQKRVDNAREIADKGNAEYLEMEQKRLDELERKREENARKQIAINNALTASQAIVAAISAIAHAAQEGGTFAILAAVTAVIGAIGASFAFVNSLQPQEANFFRGEEYVDGPPGKDKVKANLTKGERVVTAKDNQDYWETLSAIHQHKVPAEDLNRFVQGYSLGGLPLVDFNRLASATEGKLGADSVETLGRLDRLNSTMEQVVDGLSELGINVRMDENGFEASIARARKRRILRNRS